mgnify:CR=1 FL=1
MIYRFARFGENFQIQSQSRCRSSPFDNVLTRADYWDVLFEVFNSPSPCLPFLGKCAQFITVSKIFRTLKKKIYQYVQEFLGSKERDADDVFGPVR